MRMQKLLQKVLIIVTLAVFSGFIPEILKAFQVSENGYASTEIDVTTLAELKEESKFIEEVAYQETIRGVVSDATTEEFLPGVNIIVQGTTTGTSTNLNGEFEFTVSSLQDTLVVSYIGHETQVIPIDGRNVINIELMSSAIAGEELVVVGYGTQRAANITGSISRASAEDITRVSTPTVGQALQGHAAGVFIKNENAQPGENKTNINIRGFGEPLFIVDGMPVSQSVFQELNPNDIEEINVLKDAAAASVYGARAGNGVIIVQTKGGTLGRPQFSYKSEFSQQFMIMVPEPVNSWEWMAMRNMAEANAGRSEPFSRELVENHRIHADGSEPELYPNVNMFNEVIREFAPMSDHSLNIRGGTEDIRYYISGSWLTQSGMLRSDEIEFDRYSLRSNLDISLTDELDIGLHFNFNRRNYFGPRNQLEGEDWGEGQGIFARAHRWRPFYSIAELPGGFPEFPRGAPGGQTINPINAMYTDIAGYRDWNGSYADAKLSLDYELPFNFHTRAVFNYTRDDFRWKQFQKRGPEYRYNETTGEHEFVRAVNAHTEVRQRDEQTDNVNFQYFLEWDQTIAQDHNLSGMLVYEYLYESFDRFEARREQFDLEIDQLFAGPDAFQFNNNLERLDGRIGYIGRINYNYAGRYTLEASARYDASPRFPSETRWGFFPSFSAAWTISEESFMRNSDALDFVSNLRFRASFGRLGFDGAGDFQYLSTFSFSNPYIFQGSSLQRGIRSDEIANPMITWEKMDVFNAGINFTLWDYLLEGSFDVFQRDRFDVLGSRIRDIPPVVGADMPQENYLEFQNRGWDAMLRHNNNVGEVSYSIGGNISYNREKTVFRDEPDFIHKEAERRGSRIGGWSNPIWMYPTDGLFTSQEEIDNHADIDGNANRSIQVGDVKYVDTNGDGRITADDMIIISAGTQPRFTFGFNTFVGWRGFEFYTSWQGAGLFGFNHRWSEYAIPWHSDGTPFVHHRDEAYMPENDWGLQPRSAEDAKYPRLRSAPTGPSYNANAETWWVDGTYLRLRQVQIAYTLPPRILTPLGIDYLKVYASGFNLLTFSALDFLDPEIDGSPRQFFGNYHPQLGSFNFGIELNF